MIITVTGGTPCPDLVAQAGWAPTWLSGKHCHLLICQTWRPGSGRLVAPQEMEGKSFATNFIPLTPAGSYLHGVAHRSARPPSGEPGRACRRQRSPPAAGLGDENKAKRKENPRGRRQGRQYRASPPRPSRARGRGPSPSSPPAVTRRHLCPANLPAPPRPGSNMSGLAAPSPPGNYNSQRAPRRPLPPSHPPRGGDVQSAGGSP